MSDEEFLADQGFRRIRRLPSGQLLGVQRQLFTTGLFVGLDRVGYRRRFCYESAAEAVHACVTWDGTGDPPGNWIKEKPSDRMNPAWLAST